MSGLGRYFEVPVILDFHEVRDRFTRNVMILMAVASLAAGVVEFLHSRAAVGGERAGVEAQQLGAQAMAELVRGDQTAQTELEKFELEQEQRTRRSNAELAVLFRQMNPSAGGTEGLGSEVKRLDDLTKRTEQLLEIDQQFRPERDPTFPDRFFSSKQQDYWKEWARQDAANEEYGAWKHQQAWYTTVLSGYAAALYLFGLSLAIQLPVREKLVRVAVALVLVASGVAGWTLTRFPRHAPEAAAEAYAAGKQAFDGAHDRDGYITAKMFFAQAIAARKTFAQAYQDRAAASFRLGYPERMGAPGVTDLGALREAEQDAREALRLGLSNRSLLLEHGNGLFLLALEDDQPQSKAWLRPRLRESIATTRRAIDLDPQSPLLYYNLAVTYLANQQPQDAHDAYKTAVGLTLAKDGERPRYGRWWQEQFVGGALTDLESVLRTREKVAGSGESQEALACEIRTVKQYIVGSVSMREVQAPPPPGKCLASPPASDGHFEVFPVSLRWYDGLNGFPAHDVLSVQWYHRDPGLKKWVALPDVSVLRAAAYASHAYEGQVYDEVTYITQTTPPSCVPSGEYRAELYLNGRLVNPERKPISADFPTMSAVMPRDLNVAFCVPQDWQPWGEQSEPGFIIGYRSPERAHTKGVLVVRYPYPQPWIRDPVAREQALARYLQYTLGTRLHLTPVGSLSVPDAFVGLARWKKTGHVAGEVSIVAQSGVSADGAIVIGLVFGPREYIEGNQEASNIFDSILVFGRSGPDY